ncbi:MAG TPA: alpha/beta hydrolase-fold protein [Chthonomonadaceae bacterium]|nr:alpha/beta hydrolase-fold protein [Chthonomonadaceae bacterium]
MSGASSYHLTGAVNAPPYRSSVLGAMRGIHVYTPPGYDPKRARPYPVLYLLHGEPGDDSNWVRWGNLQATLDRQNAVGECEPFVVVMPDCAVPRRRSGPRGFERELVRSVLPWAESRYHVRRDSAGRALAGFSMGGFQSIAVGLSRLDKFASTVVFSAGLRPGFASEADIASAARDPLAVRSRLRLLYVRIGRRDFFLPDACRFRGWLVRRHIPCIYQEVEGGHEWPVWQGCLEDFTPRLFR